MNAVCGGKENSQLVTPFEREEFKSKEAKPILETENVYACSTWGPYRTIFFLFI